MRFIVLLIVLYSAQFTVLPAQNGGSFVASTNADEVMPGQPFEVRYDIRNAEVTDFNEPDFAPLKKISGPNVSSSIRIVNGRRSSSKSYSFTLTAPATGTYTIPAASAQMGNTTLLSNRLKVKVVPATTTEDEKGDIFIQLSVSDSSPYVGEQVILDYVLYYNQSVENIYKTNELDFSGFYATGINNFPRSVNKTTVNGKPYSRQIIRRVALFGQQSGHYTLGPLFLQVEISKGDRHSPFSIFRNTERKEIHASPLTLSVKSLPEGAPENFSGGVGKFKIQANTQDRQVSLGEALELQVRVEGSSDPNILDPPALIIDGEAEVYSPQLDYDGQNVNNGLHSFTKTWTYLVVPEKEGAFSVQPYLIHLNTETGTYDSLMADKIELWANAPSKTGNNEPVTYNEEYPESDYNNHYLYWGIGALCLLVILVLLYFYTKKKPNRSGADEQLAKIAKSIEQQQYKYAPDVAKIKADLRRLRSLKEKHSIPEETINEWIKRVDYHQYSPVKDTDKISALVSEIINRLRKV